MDERLEMIFLTAGGRRATISISDPDPELTAGEVETAMNVILEKNIFETNSGDLSALVEARIVSREVTTVFSAE